MGSTGSFKDLIAITAVTVALVLLSLALLVIPRAYCYVKRRPGRGKGYAALQTAGWLLLLTAFVVQAVWYWWPQKSSPNYWVDFSVLRVPAYGIAVGGFTVLAGAGLLLAMLLEQHRRGQREMLLRMISTAIERRLPLGPVLEMFGRDAVGWTGKAGANMVQLMREGAALDAALERAGDPLGDTGAVLVRMGREVDNLNGALTTLSRIEQQYAPQWRAFAGRCSYLAVVATAMLGMVTFSMAATVPSLEKIFRDFKIELPLITKVMLAVSNSVATLLGALILAVICLLPLAALYVAWRFVGHSRADLSRIGRIGLPLHRACVLEALALASDGGRPIERATALLAAIYPRWLIRGRLAVAHVSMLQGHDWLDSLRDASLLRSQDVAALRAAQRQGNLGWAMRELAAAARRTLLQRSQAVTNVAFPLLLASIGLVIALIVVSMILPLTSLIYSLT